MAMIASGGEFLLRVGRSTELLKANTIAFTDEQRTMKNFEFHEFVKQILS